MLLFFLHCPAGDFSAGVCITAQLGIFPPCGILRLETSPLTTRCLVCLLATLDFELSLKVSNSVKKLETLPDLQGISFFWRHPSPSEPLSSLDMNSRVITFIHFFLSFSFMEDLPSALVRSWSFYNNKPTHQWRECYLILWPTLIALSLLLLILFLSCSFPLLLRESSWHSVR